MNISLHMQILLTEKLLKWDISYKTKIRLAMMCWCIGVFTYKSLCLLVLLLQLYDITWLLGIQLLVRNLRVFAPSPLALEKLANKTSTWHAITDHQLDGSPSHAESCNLSNNSRGAKNWSIVLEKRSRGRVVALQTGVWQKPFDFQEKYYSVLSRIVKCCCF